MRVINSELDKYDDLAKKPDVTQEARAEEKIYHTERKIKIRKIKMPVLAISSNISNSTKNLEEAKSIYKTIDFLDTISKK